MPKDVLDRYLSLENSLLAPFMKIGYGLIACLSLLHDPQECQEENSEGEGGWRWEEDRWGGLGKWRTSNRAGCSSRRQEGA